MGDHEQQPDPPTNKWLESGGKLAGDLTGSAVGGALGSIAGPPGLAAGAVGGVAAQRAMKRVADEIVGRWLAPRQAVRTGAVYVLARDQISARIVAGEQPRDDFFRADRTGRSPAEELLEGILLKAAGEYE